jgi:quinol monooxygenase YgiN
MIHVIATIHVVPGRLAEFVKLFCTLVPSVEAEAGCIEYAPAIDIETGITGFASPRADVMTVVEKWDDLAALNAHRTAPHMLKFRDASKDLVHSIEVQVLKPAN